MRAQSLKPMLFRAWLSVLAPLLLTACGGASLPEQIELSGPAMGTTYSIKLVPAEPLDEGQRARLGVLAIAPLAEVDRLMSTYRADSEISRLNRAAEGEAISVSEPTAEVVELALEIHRESGGAFDITVGPLVNAWGFGPEPRTGEPPSRNRLVELAAVVGSDKLLLDRQNLRITKLADGVYCDLSAIAKGYAVDLVAEALLLAGYRDFMVEVGGEIRTGGRNRNGGPWRIAVESPLPASLGVQRILELGDSGLATSGDYRNYYEVDGVRYSHAIDPRTLAPIRHSGASVSVLDERAARADALATALLVMGPEQGLRWAGDRHIPALFVVYNPDGSLREEPTPAMRPLLENGAVLEGPALEGPALEEGRGLTERG